MISNALPTLTALLADLDKAIRIGRFSDAINAAPCQLSLVRHIEQAILETGRAEVSNKNFHR
jgi:hypothetical protein